MKINTSGTWFVNVDWVHNHNRINLEASNFKNISSSTIEKVKKLYKDGNTPFIARQVFLKDLKQSCNDEMTYHVMKLPIWSEMFQKLEVKMEEYLKNHPGVYKHINNVHMLNFYVIRDKIQTSD